MQKAKPYAFLKPTARGLFLKFERRFLDRHQFEFYRPKAIALPTLNYWGIGSEQKNDSNAISPYF